MPGKAPEQGIRTVLVVDGEAKLARMVKLALESGQFKVVAVRTGEEALDFIALEQPALVIMEMCLQDADGVEVCRQVHEFADVPVIFLSANQDDDSKVRGLRCGDDYITKPFSLVELRARVEAVLRRAHGHLSFEVRRPTYDDGLLLIDLDSHRVQFAGGEVNLTATEYRLLSQLVLNRGKIMLYDDLLTRVWGDGYRDDHHLLRLHMTNLRKKIEPHTAQPRYIKTRRGLGYVFDPPPSRDLSLKDYPIVSGSRHEKIYNN